MKHSVTICSLIVLACITPVKTVAWIPEDCPTELSHQWEELEREIRAAAPGSPLFVPIPFPSTVEEAAEDFEALYLRMWIGTDESAIPPEERPLLAALRTGTLEYELIRVENWDPTRCLPHRRKDYYLVLRILKNNVEIARASLLQSGHLGAWKVAPESLAPGLRKKWRQTLPNLETARKGFMASLEEMPHEFQFVRVAGGPPRCTELEPCVAFRAGDRSYLYRPLDADQLFVFDADSPRHQLAEMYQRRELGQPEADYAPQTEALFSIGGSTFVVARRIDVKP
jgi:hypothetical protein